jgi:hypothetical protein
MLHRMSLPSPNRLQERHRVHDCRAKVLRRGVLREREPRDARKSPHKDHLRLLHVNHLLCQDFDAK